MGLACGIAVSASAVMAAWIKMSELIVFLPAVASSTAGLVLISLFNAYTEELVFRKASLQLLTSKGGAAPAIVLSALSFGVSHYSFGIPSGLVGALLALAFGLALGVLFLRSQSLILPVAAHISVNITALVLLR
jgi:membrane protease YdiL (CAAX protease family)